MRTGTGRQAWARYGTDVLGCVVERVSGQSLDAFFRQRIFEPLGMRDTGFCVSRDQRPRLVTVYAVTAEGRLERAPDGARGQGDYVGGPCVNFSGGAGLVSTAMDYARFLQMLLDGVLMTQLLPSRAPGLAERFRALVYQAIVGEGRRVAR